jgi:hypothetical protein
MTMGQYLRGKRRRQGLMLAQLVHGDRSRLAQVERDRMPVTALPLWTLVALTALYEPELRTQRG